jgi:hypothetical protein
LFDGFKQATQSSLDILKCHGALVAFFERLEGIFGDATGPIIGFNSHLRYDPVAVVLRALSNTFVFRVLVRLENYLLTSIR